MAVAEGGKDAALPRPFIPPKAPLLAQTLVSVTGAQPRNSAVELGHGVNSGGIGRSFHEHFPGAAFRFEVFHSGLWGITYPRQSRRKFRQLLKIFRQVAFSLCYSGSAW
jgi:hypothetical protein